MSRSSSLVVFILDDRRYGLPLDAVERVVRIVDITPLPKAPDVVLGAINVQGRLIAAVNIRARFRLPQRNISLSDQLIIARTSSRRVALVADAVEGVIEYSSDQFVAPDTLMPGIEYLAGVVKVSGGMVLIHDLETLLSLDEARRLDAAVSDA
jgi:purine-binding chemotaxis protein CheW